MCLIIFYLIFVCFVSNHFGSVCLQLCTCIEARGRQWSPYQSGTHVFWLGWQPLSSSDPPVSISYILTFKGVHGLPSSLCGCWDAISGPHVCRASILLQHLPTQWILYWTHSLLQVFSYKLKDYLWDWRATYCANMAPLKDYLISKYFKLSAGI